MRAPDGIPTDFEISIAKLFIVAIIICFAVFLFQIGSENKHCRDACRAQNYPYHFLIPSDSKTQSPAQCYCRSTENAPLKEKQIFHLIQLKSD